MMVMVRSGYAAADAQPQIASTVTARATAAIFPIHCLIPLPFLFRAMAAYTMRLEISQLASNRRLDDLRHKRHLTEPLPVASNRAFAITAVAATLPTSPTAELGKSGREINSILTSGNSENRRI